MFAILNFLIAHNFPIFQPILKILVSKLMVHRALIIRVAVIFNIYTPRKLFIPPANFVCRGYTVFTLSVRPSVRPSVRNALFP